MYVYREDMQIIQAAFMQLIDGGGSIDAALSNKRRQIVPVLEYIRNSKDEKRAVRGGSVGSMSNRGRGLSYCWQW